MAALLAGRRCVVLTGAGCSTESGIPDYRGAERPPRVSAPIEHADFLAKAEVRRRYWARATVGWTRFDEARPNLAHLALAELEQTGVVAGISRRTAMPIFRLRWSLAFAWSTVGVARASA